jgi:tol-pal system-associated acyl-CoA thioesterase
MSKAPHRFDLRVYYEDTDAGGIVYYANYFRFLERARTEMLRELGWFQSQLARDHSQIFVVGDLAARYLSPARLDDELIVETAVLNIGDASLKMQQNVLKRVDGVESLLLKGSVTLVYITHAGKAVRLPDEMRAALEPYLISPETTCP